MLIAVTGTWGEGVFQENLYIEGAPSVFVQQILTTGDPGPFFNPDANGYYYGITGTATAPYIELGCFEGLTMTDNLTWNDIRCDKEGVVATLGRRDFVDFTGTLKSLMPLETVAPILNWSDVYAATGWEKTGIGVLDQTRRFRGWLPRIYDEETGAFLAMQVHRGQFIQNSSLAFSYGTPWQVAFTLRAYADPAMPANQKFVTVIRRDAALV